MIRLTKANQQDIDLTIAFNRKLVIFLRFFTYSSLLLISL